MTSTLAGLRLIVVAALAATVVATFIAPPAQAAETRMIATADVNVRSGPSTSTKIIGLLRTGDTVTAAASTGGWTTITYEGRTAYVASRYLKATSPESEAIEAGSVQVTSAAVNLRTGAGTSFAVVAVLAPGTRVTMTGKINNGYAKVYASARGGWVSAQYLNASTAAPTIYATRYATADLLIRTTSDATFQTVGEIARGSAVLITGVTKNARAQIVFGGVSRWVTAKYLSASSPATYPVEKGLSANAIKVHRAALAQFPQITTYYGKTAGGSGDHPTGHALDIMIPGYKTAAGKALGKRVSRWARANHSSLGIHYVIWNQRIWNIQRDKEGWRTMADRGSDSANHKNHVHVSVY